MSRASLKELQSLALFGWDRQHEHTANVELLNMPSHHEHACFYQGGRQRRKRSSGVQAQGGLNTAQSQAAKSKARRNCSSLPMTKHRPASRDRKGQIKDADVKGVAGVKDPDRLSHEKQASAEGTSARGDFGVQSTPSGPHDLAYAKWRSERVSSQSTTGDMNRQIFACTPSLQIMEYSVSGFSGQKHLDAATRSAGCTTMQSSDFKLTDTNEVSGGGQGKSPLQSEYTPMLHNLPDHDSMLVSAKPTVTEPSSPLSIVPSPPSPPSPLSMTRSQENQPPEAIESEKLLPSDQGISPAPQSLKPGTCQVLEEVRGPVLEEACAPHPEPHDRQQVEQHPCGDQEAVLVKCDTGNTQPRSKTMLSPAQNDDYCAGPSDQDNSMTCSLDTVPDQAHPHTTAVAQECLQHCSLEKNPHSNTGAPESTAEQNELPALQEKMQAPACDDCAVPACPSARADTLVPVASPPCDSETAIISVELPSAAAQEGEQAVHPAQEAAVPVVPGVSASTLNQQKDLDVPCGHTSLLPKCTTTQPAAACSGLQEELDRHAMPPPKPKRNRTHSLPLEAQGPEKKACGAEGFWHDAWGSLGQCGGPPLFMDSPCLPLFQPSPSLPPGNAWMLTFLP